jgi:selenoprotein W-related protein
MSPVSSKVTIVYCRPCGYEKHAREAAAALQGSCKLTVDLVPGTGGIFEVKVGDRTVAKRAKGHFPTGKEIVVAVTAAVGQGR